MQQAEHQAHPQVHAERGAVCKHAHAQVVMVVDIRPGDLGYAGAMDTSE